MKITKIIATFIAVSALISCDKEDRLIAYTELPASAQTFVATHFPDLTVGSVTKETELFDTTYEVIFIDGTNIDFNSAGEWVDVECRTPKVPDAIIPVATLAYVVENYPAESIVDIGRRAAGYDVELTNDMDLDFSADGSFLRIDL